MTDVFLVCLFVYFLGEIDSSRSAVERVLPGRVVHVGARHLGRAAGTERRDRRLPRDALRRLDAGHQRQPRVRALRPHLPRHRPRARTVLHVPGIHHVFTAFYLVFFRLFLFLEWCGLVFDIAILGWFLL